MLIVCRPFAAVNALQSKMLPPDEAANQRRPINNLQQISGALTIATGNTADPDCPKADY